MPFIESKISVAITKQQEEEIKSKLGKAVSVLGKSESWLMVGFEPEHRLYFQGELPEKAAFVEVKLYGKADRTAYDKMTKEISAIFEEVLEIPKEKLYVAYQEYSHWGFNGSNF